MASIYSRFPGRPTSRIALFLLVLCGLAAAFLPLTSGANNPATSTPSKSKILIGRTTAFSGPPAKTVAEQTLGATLYIDSVNASGGIRGQQIELVQLDDAFTPAAAAANTETLIAQHKVVAMFFSRGTPMTEAMIPVLARYGVPLIAPSTGAMSLHAPVNPWIFNLRSSYQAEARRTVEQLVGMGMTRIGVVAINDSFGTDVMVGVLAGFKSTKLEPVFVETYDRKTLDQSKAIKTVNATSPLDAVIMVGATDPTAQAIKSMRDAGNHARVITMSTNASQGFVKALGKWASGVMVAQVFPKETSDALPLVRDTRKQLEARGKGEVLTPAMLEGAAAARLLVEALRRAPSPITPKGVIAALESGQAFDIGWPGYEVAFSPTNHTGIGRYSDVSIIASNGSFKR